MKNSPKNTGCIKSMDILMLITLRSEPEDLTSVGARGLLEMAVFCGFGLRSLLRHGGIRYIFNYVDDFILKLPYCRW